MAQGVTKFTAFVDAPRRLGRDVAGDATREAELLEQPLHALRVLANIGVDLAVGPFQVGMRDQGGPAVPRPDDVDHVEVIALDDPIEVNVKHVQARRSAPMAEQPRLDVLALQRFLQQRIVEKIDLADRKIVRRSPVGIHPLKFFRR